ncbi:MFS transporter [Tsukamurella sp. 8F]|uniref:MFS transporter n=1 Tax=unclassified Tsukamurella TaxID=2633480 RepID=UPI0023B96AF4|nr:MULTISPECIES: MFS transporter [unclassified Tsukamurella]MDF0531435.1 MFS transporter [Tsukamurella sp. 8J]MDF0587502.1 MFS transporter [Tsukamurella sp. 8F]
MMSRTQTLVPAAVPAMVLGGVAQFLVAFDASVTNVALRAIRDDLHFSAAGLSWVVDAYAIAFGGLLLLGGRLTDRVGPRRMLLGGFILFALASLAAYAVSEPWQLVAVRVLQGAAAAAVAPAAMASVAVVFTEPAERAKAFAAVAIGSASGGAAGVVLSGVLTDALGWRTVVACGAVIALAGAALAVRGAPGAARDAHGSTDWLGGVLATGGLSILTYALVTAPEHDGARTAVPFVLAAGLLAAFVAVERRVPVPLVDLRIAATRSVAVPCLVMAVVVAGQFAAFYFVSLYLQIGLGYSATRTGVAFLPFCAGIVASIAVATKLLPKVGPRVVVVLGGVIATVGFLLFAPLRADGGFLLSVLLPSLVTSFGIGMTFLPLPNVATAGLAPTDAGMVSGLVNTARQLGGALGLAALVAVSTSVSAEGAADVLPGYRVAIVCSAALIAVAVVLALLLPRAMPSTHPAPSGAVRENEARA